ncbi:hypothetical protein [Methylobacterium sp. Leaf125]|uniref:hypothetical protein n=1 Tax=Methylobacterium sp. Leaf125 TaxID=1736265 RepID=UPI000B2837A5|nr:hypothetical protein [Methylobacterium sp. Leaf125]
MINQVDQLWFRVHPERQYRLRRLTGPEILGGAVLPAAFHTIWAVVHRGSNQRLEMAYRRSSGLPCADYDLDLKTLFERFRSTNSGGHA